MHDYIFDDDTINSQELRGRRAMMRTMNIHLTRP